MTLSVEEEEEEEEDDDDGAANEDGGDEAAAAARAYDPLSLCPTVNSSTSSYTSSDTNR